jgi:hypothetical protein
VVIDLERFLNHVEAKRALGVKRGPDVR